METDLLKQLFSVKYAITDELIGHLPHPFRERAVSLQKKIVAAVHDAAADYLKKSETAKETPEMDKGLKNVPID